MANSLEIAGAHKRTEKGNNDFYYGGGNPGWDSLALAKIGVPIPIREGKTVGIIQDNKVIEYIWHPNDTSDDGLVLKYSKIDNNTPVLETAITISERNVDFELLITAIDNDYIKWIINNVKYLLPSPQTIIVENSEIGKERINLVYLNDNGELININGEETSGIALEPNLPSNSIKLASFTVTEYGMETPDPVDPNLQGYLIKYGGNEIFDTQIFKGKVKGIPAVANDEFTTKGQINDLYKIITIGGSNVISGPIEPTISDGNEGDFYLNTETGILYGPKEDGEWNEGVSLKGKDGITPIKGLDYFDGTNGLKGNDGLGAFEQWKIYYGFPTATFNDFVLSLKGEKGDTKFVGVNIEAWEAKSYLVGELVSYDNRIYSSDTATTAGDVPGVSNKWVDTSQTPISTNPSLGNSDTLVPSQKATKTYVDNKPTYRGIYSTYDELVSMLPVAKIGDYALMGDGSKTTDSNSLLVKDVVVSRKFKTASSWVTNPYLTNKLEDDANNWNGSEWVSKRKELLNITLTYDFGVQDNYRGGSTPSMYVGVQKWDGASWITLNEKQYIDNRGGRYNPTLWSDSQSIVLSNIQMLPNQKIRVAVRSIPSDDRINGFFNHGANPTQLVIQANTGEIPISSLYIYRATGWTSITSDAAFQQYLNDYGAAKLTDNNYFTGDNQFTKVVKGVDGVADEDFVTKAQLEASTPTINFSTISGNARDNADLLNEIEILEAVDNSKVDKISGKSLSSNDFSDIDKIKLDNLSNYSGFRGAQASLALIKSAYPDGATNDWAIVTNPTGNAYFAVWDEDISDWVEAGQSPTIPGTNLSYTISGNTLTIVSDTGNDVVIPLSTTTQAGLQSKEDKTKLDGIAISATANDSDVNLKARANHTGTQTASTISDFNSATDARITTGITGKLDKNPVIIGATKTKITYDVNGLITSATDATTADIADSTGKRYVTENEKTTLSRTITGTTNQVNVANGSGVGGNPTLSLPQDIATSSTPQFGKLGLGAAANIGAYLTFGANTSAIGSILMTPSAVDYTGTNLGTFWNNGGEIKFVDTGVITNRLLKVYNNALYKGTGTRVMVANTVGDMSATEILTEQYVTDTDVIFAITGATYSSNRVTITPASSKIFYQGQMYDDGTYTYLAIDDNKVRRW